MFGHKVNPLIYYSKIYSKYTNLWFSYIYNSYVIRYFCYIFYWLNFLKQFFFLNNFNICILNNKYSFQLNLHIILYIYNYLYRIQIYLKKVYLLKYLYKKQIPLNKWKINPIMYINFLVLKNPFYSIDFVFNYLKNKLNKMIFLRKILKQIALILINIKKSYIKGVKILISGRINGVSIAKTESCNYGLNSFNNYLFNIKYNNFYVKTKFGILGFKIWLFST